MSEHQQSKLNSKSFLISLEKQILSDYEVNKYQIRYLFSSLLDFKPHYEILRYLKRVKFFPDNLCKDYKPKDRQYLSLEVYDQNKKIHKFLQVYLVNSFYGHSSKVFEQTASYIQSIGHANLVLQLLDFYTLDSDCDTETPSDFFVAEFEMFEMTLKEYREAFGVAEDQMRYPLRQQIDYCQEIGQLSKNYYRSNFEDIYVWTDDSGQIKLKYNILENSSFQEIITLSQYDEQYKKLSTKIEQDIRQQPPKQDQTCLITEEKRQALQKYANLMKETNFLGLQQPNDQKISKESFMQQLLKQSPDAFEFHGQTIFRRISENPKYKQFDIIQMNNKKFTFIVTQTDDKICYIKGKKCVSIIEALNLQSKFQKLIDYSNVKITTTITKVELIKTENEQYSLLLEKRGRDGQSRESKLNLIMFISKQKSTYSLIEFNSIFKNYLCELIKFSYHLLIQHSIQITRIDPCQIFTELIALGEEENGEKKSTFTFEINDFDESDYSSFYIQSMLEFFSTSSEDILYYMQKIFKQFFESISERNMDQLEEYNLKIQRFFESTNQMNQLKRQLGFNQFYVETTFEDNQFSRLNVNILSFKFNKKQILTFLSMINNVSLNRVEFYNQNYENLIQYEKNQYQRPHFSSENQDFIAQFYSSLQGDNLQLIELINQQLVILFKKYLLELNLSTEKTSFQVEGMILLNKDFGEVKPILAVKKILSSSQTCLRLSISKKESSEETSSIKIILADNNIFVVLCESPLIVQQQNSKSVSSFEEYFLRAEWYYIVKGCFSPLQNQQVILYKDTTLLQLLITKNIKELKSLKMYLTLESIQNYIQYHTIFAEHYNLQFLIIVLDCYKQSNTYGRFYMKEEDTSQLIKNLAIKVKELMNQPRNLNTLLLKVKNNNEDRSLSILKYQMYKSIRLVKFTVEFCGYYD